MTAPTHLRVEHLDEPLGITVERPRLSWRLPAGARRQHAFQIRAGVWTSGRVDSDEQRLVPYTGPVPDSGQRVEWTVKVWTDTGESQWARPGWWETGLLRVADWVAQWIEPPPEAEPHASHAAWQFRLPFTVKLPLDRARLYVTAHGIYECFLNGRRVGDRELTPGFTAYHAHLQVDTYDVTTYVRAGENVLGAIVSDGWYRGLALPGTLYAAYGENVALLAQLHLHGADGALTTLATGPRWRAATGSIRSANLIEGMTVDLGLESDWTCPTRTAEAWRPVAVGDYDTGRLHASPAPPVRRVEELRPVSVDRPRLGVQVFDLGQNINGWTRLTRLPAAGTGVSLLHGEALDEDGDVTVANVSIPGSARFQRDCVIPSAQRAGFFEPRHTTHGFRFVRVEGHPDELTCDDLAGVVVHTDMKRTGWFECSDARLNRLHEAVVWSFRGNACDIPTDCPTRERMGWTGDWQIFVSTAAYLYDVAGFATKWLADLAAEQHADGVVPHCVPEPTPRAAHDAHRMPPGPAGYGDAAVIVPWEIYRAYGDRDLLERQWSSMSRWVDHAAASARAHRHATRIAARPTPAARDKYLWDTGFHWGEWLEPGAFGDGQVSTEHLAEADHGELATAYLHHSASLLARIAHVLGRPDDSARYGALAARVRDAWQTEFLRPDGSVGGDTQASYVRALVFDLVPQQLRATVAERLAELVDTAGNHLTTGFLSTPYLLPVLADTGYVETAYALLLQESEPSWLTMILRGATTMWEHWSALDAEGRINAPGGVGSLNHYSKGAVASFLHQYVGGIRTAEEHPGYRRFIIQPMPGGGLTHARATYDSSFGTIESRWSAEGAAFRLQVTVPPGASADVRLPDGQRIDASPGTAEYRCIVPMARPAL